MYLKGDFHIHSNNSDGKLNVYELIDAYKKENFNVIAITDHDNMNGCKEAIEYGKTKNIKVIPGIEVSTKYNGDDIHILGYFKEDNLNKKDIVDYAKEKKESRITRTIKMVNALKKYFNIEIDADKLLANSYMIGRPHIANEIIKAGYANNFDEVFEKYLGDDSPAFISNSLLTPQEGIDLLKMNGATIALAHPVLIKNTSIEDLLDKFKFDGMEAIYAINTPEETEKFLKICEKRNMLVTAGSDFHDYNMFKHGNIGDVFLDEENIKKLINKIELIG